VVLRSLAWLPLVAWGCGGDAEDKDTVPVGTTPPAPDTTTGTSDTGGTETEPDPHDAYPCFADLAYDDGADGTVDGVGFDGYDEAEPTDILFAERDLNGNGTPEYWVTYERDANGDVVRYVREGSDPYDYVATYDANHQVLTYARDDLSDGSVNYAYAYTRDPLGNSLHYELDEDGDGDLDYVLDYQRDAFGNRISAQEDSDGDGDVDLHYRYTYDAELREIELEGADDEDFTSLTYRKTTTYTDPVLRIGTALVDSPVGDGEENLIEFVYDADGRELYSGTDVAPFDGIFELEETMTYDGDGRLIEFVFYTTIYGDPLELRQEWAWDALGRQVFGSVLLQYVDGEVLDQSASTWTFGGSCPS
jgi:hypothetical protein